MHVSVTVNSNARHFYTSVGYDVSLLNSQINLMISLSDLV